jgi:hypothetical protein
MPYQVALTEKNYLTPYIYLNYRFPLCVFHCASISVEKEASEFLNRGGQPQKPEDRLLLGRLMQS